MSYHSDSADGADAIDVSDFVYAATGAHVRRLTMPDGSHWFPAADVCRELGYANNSDAVRQHVPEGMRCVAGTLVSREGTGFPTGQGLRKTLVMLSLQGLIRLVNGCVKPECEPFKNWVTEVVVEIQRTGSYELATRVGGAPDNEASGFAMPAELVDVIARLEARNADLDEEFAKARQQECEERQRLLSGQRELISGQRELTAATRETAVALGRIAQAMEGAAERLSDRAADRVLRRMVRGLAPDDGGTDFDVPPGGCSCRQER